MRLSALDNPRRSKRQAAAVQYEEEHQQEHQKSKNDGEGFPSAPPRPGRRHRYRPRDDCLFIKGTESVTVLGQQPVKSCWDTGALFTSAGSHRDYFRM